jgi:putative ABC transport system permease protein
MRDWADSLRKRLVGLSLDPAREAEIVEELAQHLDERYEELRRRGLDDASACAAVSRELRDGDTLGAALRELKQANLPTPIGVGAPGRNLYDDFRQDLRLAARKLRKQPWLSAAVVLTLALGIGANGAIFALVDAVLLRDLPLPDPARVMVVAERTEKSSADQVSPLDLIDWSDRSRSFTAIGGYVPNVGGMVMSGPGGAETVSRQWVTAGVFTALGLTPIAGRTFLATDDTPQSRLAVLAEDFWRARFQADPAIVGQSVRLDGEPYTVIGVVPNEAQIIGKSNVWALMPIRGAPAVMRRAYFLKTVARLEPGVSSEAARSELSRVAANLAVEYPTTNEGRGIVLSPLRDSVLGSELRRTSLLFLGVVGFVLLVCFANVANLLSTRTSARGNELAIRAALGADRKRLLRQFWTESLVLSCLGSLGGLVVAAALLRAAPFVIPAELLPAGLALAFDLRVVAFCALAALCVGLAFSLATAPQVTTLAASGGNGPGGRIVTDRTSKTRELLVVAQIAAAVALLYCAGLLSRTLLELDGVDRGYRAASVLSMMVDPLRSTYPTAESLRQFYAAVESEIDALPGIASVAWTSALPMGDSIAGRAFYEVVGEAPPVPSERPSAELLVASPRYFSTMDLPVTAGRAFDERDTPDGAPVCMVNAAFARRRPAGRPVLGERLSVAVRQSGEPDATPYVCEIVGVSANTKREADELEAPAQIYVPLSRLTQDDIYLLVRPAAGDAKTFIPSVRAAIGRIDRAQLVSVRDIMTLDAIGHEATARYRFRATLVAAFASLALLLATVGLFGALAYTVQRRWREYGVRMALGAQGSDVMVLIARGAARLVVPGVVIGGMLALAMGQTLGAMLFGVRPTDPITLAAVLAVLALTVAAAILAPALRATRVNPAGVLRGD